MRTFIVLCSMSLLVMSCDPAEQYKTELAEIDSYLSRIDSLENKFDGIEFDSLRLMVDNVNENEDLIKELYSPDTLDAAFGRQMNDAKAIRKTLADVDRYEGTIGDELNAVKHQLMDLKADILEGLYKDDQIREYLDIEKAALTKVDQTFYEFYETQAAEKKRYYLVVPKIDAFIEELKAKRESGE